MKFEHLNLIFKPFSIWKGVHFSESSIVSIQSLATLSFGHPLKRNYSIEVFTNPKKITTSCVGQVV